MSQVCRACGADFDDLDYRGMEAHERVHASGQVPGKWVGPKKDARRFWVGLFKL